MVNPAQLFGERPSTYVVQDRSNQEELRRLQLQECLMTLALGRVLPEQADPTRLHQVLDMACGAGGWLIELAHTTPTISRLVGMDTRAGAAGFAFATTLKQGWCHLLPGRGSDEVQCFSSYSERVATGKVT